jgi:peptidoglycan/LPS O-acetylase OafA/YrhL
MTAKVLRPQSAPDARLHHIDGIRALAALWVVCNHVWLTIYPTVGAPSNPHGLLAVTTGWMIYGHFAVIVFIVVSGYSLAISTTANGHRLPGSFTTFLRRRFTRIVLPYWGALLISLVLATTVLKTMTGTHWDSALPVTIQGALLHVGLLQDTASPAQINHAMWSIAIEWHLYLLFPLILLLRRRIGLLATTALAVAVGAFVSSLFDGGLTLWAEANLLGCFAIGIAAREIVTLDGALRLSQRHTIDPSWRTAAAVSTAGVVALVIWFGSVRAMQSNTLLEPLVGAATGCLLVALGCDRASTLRRALSWKPLVVVGSFSYSLYLLHAPLLQLIWQYAMRPLRLPLHNGYALAALLALGIPLSILVGWIYFQLVERRCMPRQIRICAAPIASSAVRADPRSRAEIS